MSSTKQHVYKSPTKSARETALSGSRNVGLPSLYRVGLEYAVKLFNSWLKQALPKARGATTQSTLLARLTHSVMCTPVRSFSLGTSCLQGVTGDSQD